MLAYFPPSFSVFGNNNKLLFPSCQEARTNKHQFYYAQNIIFLDIPGIKGQKIDSQPHFLRFCSVLVVSLLALNTLYLASIHLNLTPLVPLSKQEDGTSPANNYVWRGEEILRGACAPLRAYSLWGGGAYDFGISLRCYEGGGWEKIYLRGPGVRQSHPPMPTELFILQYKLSEAYAILNQN